MTSKFVLGAVQMPSACEYPWGMARIVRPILKAARRPTFIKAWRTYRNRMKQDKLVERLENETGYVISTGQLSRIERGQQPYTQDLLEALATVLSCTPADLIMRDPNDEDAAWSLLESLKPVERQKAVKMIELLKNDEPGTGTVG